MSAPGSCLFNRLPAEILLKILQLVVEPTDHANSPSFYACENSNCTLPINGPQANKLFAPRRDLALVCRWWNTIATCLLYDHITVRPSRPDQLAQLAQTLHGLSSNRQIGRLVHRLDFVASLDFSPTWHVPASLCQHTPNLVTLVIQLDSSETRDSDSPVSLLKALGPRLRHLRWEEAKRSSDHPRSSKPGYTLTSSELLDFMEHHPDLTSISLPFAFTLDPEPESEADSPTPLSDDASTSQRWANTLWPRIREWAFQDTSQVALLDAVLPASALPNLQTVKLHVSFSTQPGGAAALRSFLTKHGEGITSMLFTQCSVHDRFEADAHLALDGLCPHMHSVHLALTAGCRRPVRGVWPSVTQRIRTLGIELVDDASLHPPQGKKATELQYGVLHRFVAAPWTRAFPVLDRIRVMECVDVGAYRRKDEVTRWWLSSPARLVNQPIRVEDVNGQVLGELSKGLCTLRDRARE